MQVELGGSVAAGTSAFADRIVKVVARVFGSPVRRTVVSPLVIEKGKKTVIETSASEYSLVAPHFAPADFETGADLIPFVEGVSNLVSLASSPSLFTELNEFDEGYSAVKRLAVRVCCSPFRLLSVVRLRRLMLTLVLFALSFSFDLDSRGPLFNRTDYAGLP